MPYSESTDTPVDVDDSARVRRQAERFRFRRVVTTKKRSDTDGFVQVHMYTDETLEHVGVGHLTCTQQRCIPPSLPF